MLLCEGDETFIDCDGVVNVIGCGEGLETEDDRDRQVLRSNRLEFHLV